MPSRSVPTRALALSPRRPALRVLVTVLVTSVVLAVVARERCAAVLAAAGPGGDEWSYSRLIRPAVPTVADTDWVRNPIDAFVLAGLEAVGLRPNPATDDATLMRRATYDLHGLPPSPKAVADYVADPAADKYERLIDRLLDSPHYGEKWGRHWLDLVRFAETDSFERDRLKPGAWRYRDWVIDAFNRDMPYAQFVTEQLAGDELDQPTLGSMVATGYYRLGIWDDEPTDTLQAVYDDLDGVVDTTSRVFLGVSMGCARCHDHKKDPISTRDYYRMLAFFEGLAPYKVGGGNATTMANYVQRVPVDLGASRFEDELRAFRERRDAALREVRTLVEEAQSRAPAGSVDTAREQLLAGCRARLDFEVADDSTDPEFAVEGKVGRARRFGRGGDPLRIARPIADDFTITFWFRTRRPGHGSGSDLRWFSGSGLVDGEVPGITDDFGVSLIGGQVAAGVGNPETFVHSADGHADGEWHHVAFTRARASGRIELFVDGVAVADAVGGQQALTAPAELSIGRLQPGGHDFVGSLDDVRIYDRVLAAREVLALAEGDAFRPGVEVLVAEHVGKPEADRCAAALDTLAQLRRPTRDVVDVLCARENSSAVEPSYVRLRGNVHAKGDAVTCGYPAALGGGDAEFAPPASGKSSGRRLSFARWLLQPDHPRTWRVLANRIWQHHFGRGIVRSSNDFGNLGDEATHPELLDWLASEIVAGGTTLKRIHRLVLTSSAYRMSSKFDPRAFEVDPRNDRFWRFERRRLTAEELRDSMLAVDGTLNLERGGPGIYPKMPAEVLATSSRPDDAWGRSTPEQAARRSIYVHVKRSMIMPMLQSFDLADTDATCPVRFVTTLPTQALTMLNSELVNDSATALAARLQRERPDDRAGQFRRGLGLVTQQPADAADLDSLERLYQDLTQQQAASAEQALQLCCLAMLNLNAFVYVD
ncbi:MAG: DUF1553 domain-containing protein [Planctomycetota bacterium]